MQHGVLDSSLSLPLAPAPSPPPRAQAFACKFIFLCAGSVLWLSVVTVALSTSAGDFLVAEASVAAALVLGVGVLLAAHRTT